ncbi:MnhB domain-containing protein [Actinoalloteichus hymeniacidonis]|uniref:Multisubunit Na+/H+ antiporter, MnhB subunit n=1 Tax=Actinoalloteichus hymeniacidonis TaxID=340345 RepID=A0AAC9N0N8_9PSEU|nr:MnhB domain-containing protein [Actinoalloteichus hymeniacidonis]AOS65580.1 multisubunit Na+/H+ antiporter, MnhB subunit [Actinoalloteichus hymeniacidonis]MBB5906330.1 multisubunit Na+/H+ antiporter MnhB subunit [Actinoalloteichus hymeniacidonis]
MTIGRLPSWEDWDTPREQWLLAGDSRDGRERSVLLEVAVRLLFPTVLVLSLYLLFAGHNRAGGGFSGGLVAGQAFVLRYIAGGPLEMRAAVKLRPPVIIGLGLSLAVLSALVPTFFGGHVLESYAFETDLPVLGHLKFVTSLLLDVGVYVLIVGVVIDLLRTLGAGIEEQLVRNRRVMR